VECAKSALSELPLRAAKNDRGALSGCPFKTSNCFYIDVIRAANLTHLLSRSANSFLRDSIMRPSTVRISGMMKEAIRQKTGNPLFGESRFVQGS
jgi:hypothetical protein